MNGLRWNALRHHAERWRPAPARTGNTDARGEVDPLLVAGDGNPLAPLRFRLLIQPGAGTTDDFPEGVAARATHRGYCNFRASREPRAPVTDVQVGDRLRLIDHRTGSVVAPDYWVIFVSDEGGQGDHLKLLLTTLTPDTPGGLP